MGVFKKMTISNKPRVKIPSDIPSKKMKEFKVTCQYTYIAEDREECKRLMSEDGALNDCEDYSIEEIK